MTDHINVFYSIFSIFPKKIKANDKILVKDKRYK